MPRTKPRAGQRPHPLSADLFAHMVRKALKRLQKAHDQCQLSAILEHVHRMRRASRHVRALLDVCRHWEKSGKGRDLHDRIRQLLHALGPLRDLQVRIETLRALARRHQNLAPLLRRAEKEEREERAAVRELMVKMEIKEAGVLRRRIRRGAGGPPRPALMRTITLETRELRARWKAMRAKDPRSLHRARVALRRLTHLLASMSPYLAGPVVATLPTLKRMQEDLGRTHDKQMLLDWTSSVLMKLPASHRPAIAAFHNRTRRLLDRRVATFLREHPEPGI